MNGQRFYFLDGLRGVVALCVVIYHLHYTVETPAVMAHARLAVDFFFMLSGVVIALSYEERLATGRLTFRTYAARRAMRLFPLLVLGALLGLAVATLRGGDPPELLLAFALAALSLPNFFAGMLFPLNAPAWSLFYELAINAVYGLTARRLTHGWLVAVIAFSGALLAFVAHQDGGVRAGVSAELFLSGIPRVVFPFCLGIGIYRAWKAGWLPKLNVPVVVPAGVVVLTFLPPFSFQYSWIYDVAMIALVYPLVTIACMTDKVGSGARWLSHWSGELSYPIYALHMPILGLVALTLGSNATAAMIAGSSSMVVGFVALKWFDEPTRAWLHGAFSRARPVVS